MKRQATGFKILCHISLANSGGASLQLMAGHRHGISRISKGNQNISFLSNNIYLISIYYCSITTFYCQGGGISARAFALARPGVEPPLLAVF